MCQKFHRTGVKFVSGHYTSQLFFPFLFFPQFKGCLLLSSKHYSSFNYMSHRHRAKQWENSVLNWGVCLDRLDKYFFYVVVSTPQFCPDSHRRGSEQFKLHYIMGWVAAPSKTHGCLSSCLFVYTSLLALGIN